MYISILPGCLYVQKMYVGAHGGQKKESFPPETGFIDARNRNGVFCKSSMYS